jgi:hypothetical protein
MINKMNLFKLLFTKKAIINKYLPQDKILAEDIISLRNYLPKNTTPLAQILKKDIDQIYENEIFNSDILYQDLYKLFASSAFDSVFKKIREAGGNKEQTDINSFFEQLGNLSQEDFSLAESASFTYQEYYEAISTLIAQQELIKDHLKLKILFRYFKNAIKNNVSEKQSKLSSIFPINLSLREYFDNIYNIKKVCFDAFIIKMIGFFILNINSNGDTRQNKHIVFAS